MTLIFPTLETERLILRGPAEEDFGPMLAFARSRRSDILELSDDHFAAWRAFLAGIGHWALRGYGFFTLVERDGGAIAGRVGLINHDGWPEPEIGWHLYDGFEGKGLAMEAALAVRPWAAREHGLTRLISLIDAGNTRSLALARRLGAVHERDVTVHGHTDQLWRHPEEAAA